MLYSEVLPVIEGIEKSKSKRFSEGMSECSGGTDGLSRSLCGDYNIKVFHPTWEEFQDFPGYIKKVELAGGHLAGICKIIPPKEWCPQQNYIQFLDSTIENPIEQVVEGSAGLFQQFNFVQKPLTVQKFEQMSQKSNRAAPEHDETPAGWEELERQFWRLMTYAKPIYGADLSGTVTDPDTQLWNFQKLPSLLDLICRKGADIQGVTSPYLYYGMWKATFPWHTEDMDLYSINYLHYGQPKTWYAIPPEHGKRFETAAAGLFPVEKASCQNFLRHKMTIISPQVLKKYNIPVTKTVHLAGQMIVTFPFAYHMGFNHGFNCAEAVNFATERWIEFGKWATVCKCRPDIVQIDMEPYVQLYQPDRYFRWINGKDVNRINYTRVDYPTACPNAAFTRLQLSLRFKLRLVSASLTSDFHPLMLHFIAFP